MKIATLTYTYPPDFEVADRAVRTIRKRWERTGLPMPTNFWVVHEKDAGAAAAYFDGAEYYRENPGEKPTVVTHRFDAGGHLQHRSACRGMRICYRGLYVRPEKFDAVIKIDSDCMVLRPECFTNPVRDSEVDHVYVPQKPSFSSGTSARFPFDAADNVYMHQAWGPAYLLSRKAMRTIINYPQEDFEKMIVRCHGNEDQVFSRIVQVSRYMRISEIRPKFCIGSAERRLPDEWTVYCCDNPRKQSRQVFDVNGNRRDDGA